MSIDTFLLPDFQTCLRYSVQTKRNFICIAKRIMKAEEKQTDKKNPRSAPHADVEPIPSMEDDIKLAAERDEPPAIQLQRAIHHHQIGDKLVLRSSLLKKDFAEHLHQKSSHHEPGLEIVIIPNINDIPIRDQGSLVRWMRDSAVENAPRIFIGLLQWDPTKEETCSGETESRAGTKRDSSKVPYEKHLQSKLKINDWLRHKFWFACSMPKSDSINSSLSSGYFSEAESLTDMGAKDIVRKQRIGDLGYSEVHIEPSLRRYVLDVMVHLRIHRLTVHGKGGGVHTGCLEDILTLAQLMCLDDNKEFVTPREIKQAMRWYFPVHLMLITNPLLDTSILYGSKIRLIDEFLSKVARMKQQKSLELENPLILESLVVQDVLSKVVPPI
ncbi:Mtc2p KNAG_0A06560 [Huiozyma naganishii CBS 8797]|uniref:Maintenance of telomere capping protein 2 n=1 Tax=Huiozyma naganishii (strain ATCC MYA-139 / BCRC 22969 / CBS 8797 / KCTC 17520 / NBRC 10181 / NCYC 3082 / Yp74L-3) TaxID=1071383 RepID=J7RFI5_HUIN7|nr:hypothetical protein KNAG_0A06560 [Kazachstania naganishii CBS 8797]CCK68313.1 hypothetical protein KNAG_0A06560 [Kazachstania naganishii CBS 8797]